MNAAKGSTIYSIRPTHTPDHLSMEKVWSGADLGEGITQLVPVQMSKGLFLIGYDRSTEKACAFALTGAAPWIAPVESRIALPGGPWDQLKTFVLGNEHYLMTYRADEGMFGFFHLSEDLVASKPYEFVLKRNTPTVGFTTVEPFSSLGQQYILGYEFEKGIVAAFSLAVTTTSAGGVPPLLALNVWYHQWAKGWTRFAFFQLGGSNFFFKINTAKLNVNIDHMQDNPAAGSVEVGSWLQAQLPDALSIDIAEIVPWANGEPYFLTYIAGTGATAVHRIHADCLGWTNVASHACLPAAKIVKPYRVGDATFALFHG